MSQPQKFIIKNLTKNSFNKQKILLLSLTKQFLDRLYTGEILRDQGQDQLLEDRPSVTYNNFECLSYEYFLCFNIYVSALLLFAAFLF